MKTFTKLFAAVIAVYFAAAAGLNIWYFSRSGTTGYYRVEAKRIADDIENTGTYDLAEYPHLTGVFSEDDGDLYKSDNEYLIVSAGGRLYRVEYEKGRDDSGIIAADIVLAVLFCITLGMLLYLRRHLIRPFTRINEVPKELAKGNLAVEIPEEKSRFLGKFTWGVNLLREKIEDDRKKELSLQREKKLLLLSISHDIKTPLSAIKLNAKALAKGLYKDESKRLEAAESINSRADEIENFVSQITKAASEDFMTFEVKQGEEFLSKIISRLRERYEPVLSVRGTQFVIGEYNDCILSCDPDRLAECLQNLMENAIKYSDGKKIELRFECVDGCELITVSNTGCSLEPEELTTIFDSFQRGKNAQNAPGNGLGLFICRKLMGLMGGEAFARIENGCFEVTLVVKLA